MTLGGASGPRLWLHSPVHRMVLGPEWGPPLRQPLGSLLVWDCWHLYGVAGTGPAHVLGSGRLPIRLSPARPGSLLWAVSHRSGMAGIPAPPAQPALPGAGLGAAGLSEGAGPRGRSGVSTAAFCSRPQGRGGGVSGVRGSGVRDQAGSVWDRAPAVRGPPLTRPCDRIADELELIRPSVYRNVARQLNLSLQSETVVTDAFLAVAAQIFSAGRPVYHAQVPTAPARPGSVGQGGGCSAGGLRGLSMVSSRGTHQPRTGT